MARNQTTIDKIVGRIGEDYYGMNYTFEDGDFRGITGSVLRPISERERDERMDPENAAEYFKECWQEAVKAGSTEQGLESWVEEVLRYDGESAVFDLSYSDLGNEAAKLYNARLDPEHDPEEEAEFSECIGGGRCFHAGMKWDEVFEPELIALIDKFETARV